MRCAEEKAGISPMYCVKEKKTEKISTRNKNVQCLMHCVMEKTREISVRMKNEPFVMH